MSENVLQQLVHEVLKKLYDNDYDLIIHRPEDTEENALAEWQMHVGERAISFRFGYYLQRMVSECPVYKFLCEYNIDSEYNRCGYNKKATPSFEDGIYPDLIIHKRIFSEETKDNVLVIEIKTWWNSNTDRDMKKIADLTSDSGRYGYKAGVSILLKTETAELRWIKQDECESCYSLTLKQTGRGTSMPGV